MVSGPISYYCLRGSGRGGVGCDSHEFCINLNFSSAVNRCDPKCNQTLVLASYICKLLANNLADTHIMVKAWTLQSPYSCGHKRNYGLDVDALSLYSLINGIMVCAGML